MSRPYRHTFRFKVKTNDGEEKIIAVKVRVHRAKAPVTLTLTAADVRRSIELKGVGNTQTCSMAVCAKRHAQAFPHPVDGFIDWQYARAYVVSKISKATGLPTECYCYAHSDDIAKVNDSRGGQKKLLADLEAGGARKIKLMPPPKFSQRESGRPRGREDGSRTIVRGVGAKYRFAVAQLGGVPQ